MAKRTLGAAPEEHAKRAKFWIDKAMGHANEAARLARNMKCARSMDYLLQSESFFTKSQVNASDAGLKDYGEKKSTEAFVDAEKTFKKHCLVGGGLSGLRRRKKR